MNYVRFKIISDIVDGKPSRLRESYFTNNYISTLNEIKEYTKNIDVPFIQRIWHWVNEYPSHDLCKCGNKTSFNRNWLDGYKKYCSAKCAQSSQETKEKRKKTTIEKYGVDNISKLDGIKLKQEKTNFERYGTKSSFQNEKVKDKAKKTNLDRYGEDHYFKTGEFKEKSKQTNLEKYGSEHYAQTEEYIEKTIKTNNEKFGQDWYTQTDEYLTKSKITNNEKFGVDHYSKSEEYKIRVKETNLEKYDTEWYYQSDDFKEKSKKRFIELYGVDHFSKSDEYKKYIESCEYKQVRLKHKKSFYEDRGFEYISSEKIGHAKLRSCVCGHEFDIHPSNLQRRMLCGVIVCTICNPIDSQQSGQELNVVNWIKSLGVEIEIKKRDIISPYELDILIPDKNIAIEYNGLYWHSEVYKEKDYHLNKMLRCSEVGIDLIQIWEDDWLYREDIIKSIILGRIGLTKNKIYARKCELREVIDKKSVRDFFNMNHIQGATNYKTAIGLYYKDVLVCCMLFHRPKKEIELVRFVSLINCSVVGGASRLFKFYVKNYDCDKIVSFADRSIFNGNLYIELGFDFINRTPINYWWVIDGLRKHRFNYNKKKLIKEGFDENLSESEIMRNRGFYKIHGCGLDKYIFLKNK